jgi:hypothetical protein
MQRIWQLTENDKRREKAEADEVVIEFKQDQLDPTRKIVEWEKDSNIVKRNELKKKTKMINKGKDMKHFEL